MSAGRERRTGRLTAVVWATLLIGTAACTAIGPTPGPARTSEPSTTHVSSSPAGPSGPAAVTQRRPGWALDRIDQRHLPLDQRFTAADGGRGVTVYVVDGLFDVTNPEFGGRASVGLKLGRACDLDDGTDHGLFVAGLVGGRRTGVAKRATIVSVGSSYGCEGGTGGATQAQVIARVVRALGWVAEHARRPAVVNLSLNGDGPSPELSAAVRRLTDAGLTVIASAGNDGDNACRHPPAGLPLVITVSGSTRSDTDAGLNHGRCVDLYAPAEGVRSVVDAGLVPEGLVTSEIAATSWAAPLVSGAAALYLSAHADASPAEVRGWLIDNATTGALHGNLHGSPNRLLFTGGPL